MVNDGNGNQPTYDAENRIVTDAGVNYYYDADGFRMEKSSGTMYWPGPGGVVLAETDLSGNINEEYVYFGGERLARVDRPSGMVHYYISDHLGSASTITDASGNVAQRYYYYPYGGLVASVGSDPNHYEFTGKERDTESNLDNFGARYYTSNIGRFMTPDWAAKPTTVPYAVFGDPQTLNLYTYVENAPVNRADADGHYMGFEYQTCGCGGWGPDLITDSSSDMSDTSSQQGQQAQQQVAAQQGGTAQNTTQQPDTASGTNSNPNAAAEQHQYDLVVERTNKLVGSTDASDHIDPNGKLIGGNYEFPINNNDKSDTAFRSSLNKAFGEADGDKGSHVGNGPLGLASPTHRVGFSTSLHHDNDALHVDHFNGAKFPIGTLLHAIVDVGIGHLPYYGSNHAFSYAGVQ